MPHHDDPSRPVAPDRRPRTAAAVLLVGAVATGLAVAVALPVLLPRGSGDAGATLREELQSVVDAQRAYDAAHGSYTSRLSDLGLGATENEVAVVRAGSGSYCVGAHDPHSGSTLFYSPAGGFSTRACA